MKPLNFKGKFQGTYLINHGTFKLNHGWLRYILMYHGLDVGAVPPNSLYKTQAEINYGNLLLVT